MCHCFISFKKDCKYNVPPLISKKCIKKSTLPLQLRLSIIQATIFLIEGILIGTMGGVVGVLLALTASIPGDAWVRAKVEQDMSVKLQEALFVFPPWLVVTVIVLSWSG